MCRQTHSTLTTPIRNLKEMGCILERLLWAQPYNNKLEQFGAGESKQEKDRTPWRNVLWGWKEGHPPLRIKGCPSTSQTNMTLHNLFWKAEKKTLTVSACIFPQKTLNLIKAKQKRGCGWTALDDDCHLYQVDWCLLHNREKHWKESSNSNYLTTSTTYILYENKNVFLAVTTQSIPSSNTREVPTSHPDKLC